MRWLNSINGAILISILLHALLLIFEPELQRTEAPLENVEKVAIKFLSPVERVAAAPVLPTIQPETQNQEYQYAQSNTSSYHVPQKYITKPPTAYDHTVNSSIHNNSTVVSSSSSVNTTAQSIDEVTPQTQTVNTNRLPEYLSVIRAMVERNKEYPLIAKRMGVEGNAIVRVTINEDGYAQSINLTSSTGNKNLDSAAVNAVRNSQPFHSPARFGLSKVTIDIPISYRID